jgi:HlyD family secretion protein
MGTHRVDSRLRVAATIALLALGACRHTEEPDAYGNFEATETVVSAEASGALLWFTPTEGQQVAPGTLLGVIDTAQLALDRAQIRAQRSSVSSRETESARQIDVLEVQREFANRTYARTRRLFAEKAATAQQLEQAEREYRVLGEQLAAARAQRQSVSGDASASDARVAQIADRIAKSRIAAPFAGTVLATYTRAGEFVQPGQPLFRLANLDSLTLRAYVTEPQLSQLRIGQRVEVSVDRPEGVRLTVPGTVSWVAAKAEFTPTPVQTRDERADLVYAVKIRVANRNGVLKIGMPADVAFPSLARS